MAYFVKPDTNQFLSGFRDFVVAEASPRVQIDAVCGVVGTDVEPITSGAGSISVESSTFVLDSGAGAGDFATIRSKRVVRYRPGQASRYRFTAAFAPTSDPAAFQGAGAFTATDGLLVLQLGGAIGVCRRIPGAAAIWRLTISSGTGGAETVTITLDGVDFPVAVGGATTAAELGAALAAETYTGWTSAASPTANGVTVTWVQGLPTATGTDFTLASAGDAAGTFAEVQAGVANSYADFRPQDEWSEDPLDGTGPSGFTLDPSKLNVYQIDHTHLGTGPIEWSVVGENGQWIKFHREPLVNRRETASQNNPTYRLGWFSARGILAESVEVRGASAAGFVCGPVESSLRNPFGASVINFTATTTSRVAIALRLRGEYAGYANQRDLIALAATAATETSNRTLRLDLVLNPTLPSPLVWSYVDQDLSAVEIAKPGSSSPVTYTGGNLLASIPIGSGAGTTFPLADLGIRLDIGDVLVLALATATSTGNSAAGITWRED